MTKDEVVTAQARGRDYFAAFISPLQKKKALWLRVFGRAGFFCAVIVLTCVIWSLLQSLVGMVVSLMRGGYGG